MTAHCSVWPTTTRNRATPLAVCGGTRKLARMQAQTRIHFPRLYRGAPAKPLLYYAHYALSFWDSIEANGAYGPHFLRLTFMHSVPCRQVFMGILYNFAIVENHQGYIYASAKEEKCNLDLK